MSMDREVVLEALSTLLEVPVKSHNSAKILGFDELNIFNVLTKTLLDIVSPTDLLIQSLGSAAVSGLRKELFVNMDEFFEPHLDYDFRQLKNNSVCYRGGEPYTRPVGWYRFALKVKDKYPDGNNWLGTDGWRTHSVSGEWPVSYHGTSIEGAKSIVKSHYKAGPRDLYGRGIYSTYDIDQASGYSKEFTSVKTGKTYRVLMQNRINPEMRKVCNRRDYWLIEVPEGTPYWVEKEIVEKSLRPYGILVKEV